MPWPKKSDEHKKKISEARIAQSGRPIECYLLETGEVIKVYPCVKDAEKDGFRRTSIYRVLNGQRGDVSNLGWRYVSDSPKSSTQTETDSSANKPFE